MFKTKIKIMIMIMIKGSYTKHFRKKIAFLTFYETINFSVSFIKNNIKRIILLSLCLGAFVAERLVT